MNSTVNTVNRPVSSRRRPAANPATCSETASDTAANTHHRRYDSRILFANSRLLVIQHEGSDYQLRITNQGKLILTK